MSQMLGAAYMVSSMVATLPAPPMLGRILYESPILSPAVALAVMIAGVAACLRIGKGRRAAIVGGIGLAVAIGLAVSTRMVTTPREHIEFQTKALIDAVAAGETEKVQDMLADRLVMQINGNDMMSFDPKPYLVGQVEFVNENIESHSSRTVRSITDSKISGRIRFSVRVSVVGGGMNFTVWQGEWRRDPDDTWRLYLLDWKKFNGQAPRGRDFFRAR